MLFGALAELRELKDPAGDVRVVFFGPSSDHVIAQARRFGVEALVEQKGVVPRPDALTAQREASDLLILVNMAPSSTFELGSKIIEYTCARRPIPAFGPSNSVMREYLVWNQARVVRQHT